MSHARKLLPYPMLSVALVIGWLWLNNTVAAGHVVLGALLGLAIPLLARRFSPAAARVRAWRIPELLAILIVDIVIANLQVARLILGPVARLRSGFVDVPLDLHTDYAITVLGSLISLTPGTVTVDVAPDRRSLRVHYLCSHDPDALVRRIKARYERRVGEIFEC